uniref:Uncharacterized protein n=1 Tax=Alloyangia mangrovi TaxID=1779329 RepID=A0A2A3JRR8_9RHOB
MVAPLATGHPLGLPGAPVRTAEETKVQPVKEQSTTDTDHGADHGTEGQSPTGFWRSLTGLPDPVNHVAPPSIMQIRISALLEEQAEALLKELRDKAIARIAVETPRMAETEPTAAPSQDEGAGQTASPDPAAEPTIRSTVGSGDGQNGPRSPEDNVAPAAADPVVTRSEPAAPVKAPEASSGAPATGKDLPVSHQEDRRPTPAAGPAQHAYGTDSASFNLSEEPLGAG